jgi:NAD(P)-dependent dehydrogenase (short-subunit alcohol dehydrogenase family)
MGPFPGEFEHQVVIVTGGAQGIGRAIMEAFFRERARVAIWDIQEEAAAETARAIDLDGQSVLAMGVDIRDHSKIDRAVKEVVARWGQIDILVNNAGVQWNCPSLELRPEDLARVVETNLIGAFYCSQAVARHSMVPRKHGVIISISSMAAVLGMPRRLAYGISKAGISAMTRVLAAEWRSTISAPTPLRPATSGHKWLRTPFVGD